MDTFVEYVKLIELVGNDHELLKALGNRVIEYGKRGDFENYNKRLELYFKILLEHNIREEEQIFPSWKRDIDENTKNECTRLSRKIIEEYGVGKYTKIT